MDELDQQNMAVINLAINGDTPRTSFHYIAFPVGQTERVRDGILLAMRKVVEAERVRCLYIAQAVDSGRGNEKDIADAIANGFSVPPSVAKRAAQRDTSLQPDGVWTDWHGGASPVSLGKHVQIERRDGEKEFGRAIDFIWRHNDTGADIVKWRVVQRLDDVVPDIMRGANVEDTRPFPTTAPWVDPCPVKGEEWAHKPLTIHALMQLFMLPHAKNPSGGAPGWLAFMIERAKVLWKVNDEQK